MKQRQQGSTSYPITFLMVDSSDHITPKTGLAPTVKISKSGAAFGDPAGAVSEVGYGWYALAGHATDRDTLGEFVLHATAAGADPADDRYVIVPWNPFDANQGLTNLDAAVSSRSTYAGADTAGTTTLLSRIPGTVQPQTGDTYARLGAPSGASVSADVAAVKTDTGGLRTDYTTARAGKLDSLDATVSSRSTYAGGPVASVTAAVTVGTNNDKTGYALTSDYDAAKTAGDATAANQTTINSNVLSRLATAGYTAPDNAGIAAIKAKTDNLPGAVKKNAALSGFGFVMVDSAGTPKTGLTVTAQRSIDGGSFGACANTVAEVGNGVYKINLAAEDLNGDTVVLRFSASGASDTILGIVTNA